MTQAPPDRLDRIKSSIDKLDQKLDAVVEKLDHKLDAISNDQSELKISLGRVEERLSGFDHQRLGTLEERSQSQDNQPMDPYRWGCSSVVWTAGKDDVLPSRSDLICSSKLRGHP